MSRKNLQEIAKFASGLVMGDFLVGVWFYATDMLPFDFLGVTFNRQEVVAWLIFDIVLFVFLIHYAWRIGNKKYKIGNN